MTKIKYQESEPTYMKLFDLLSPNNSRNADLRRLMLMCKTEAQIISVVCVGAGDAFITRYWPILRRHATQGSLSLMVADAKPLDELANEKVQQAKESGDEKAAKNLRNLYDELDNDVKTTANVRYVNISNKYDESWYKHIRADMVFVLVPDEIHINVAKQWLKRSTLILIEKPYNRELQEAVDFEHELQFMMDHIGGDVPTTWVCPFDHYLAKIAEYISKKERQRLFDRIGRLISVEFALLEAGPVEPWRAESLKAGMIYDLFSHVLAMLSAELNLSSYRQDRVREIAVARHKPCPPGFNSDTFTYFDLPLLDYQDHLVNVRGSVGKGVGNKDEKFMTFNGEFGSIKFDLDPKGSKQVLIKEEGREQPIYKIGQGHLEFIEALLAGKYIEEPIGGLTGQIAIDILRIMNRIREKIPAKIHEYEAGANKDEVIKSATRLRFR